jgi:hypothetical protein
VGRIEFDLEGYLLESSHFLFGYQIGLQNWRGWILFEGESVQQDVLGWIRRVVRWATWRGEEGVLEGDCVGGWWRGWNRMPGDQNWKSHQRSNSGQDESIASEKYRVLKGLLNCRPLTLLNHSN